MSYEEEEPKVPGESSGVSLQHTQVLLFSPAGIVGRASWHVKLATFQQPNSYWLLILVFARM